MQYQHTMNTAEQRVLAAIHSTFEAEPEKFAPEMWAVSTSNGRQDPDFEARVTYSETLLRLNEDGVECELFWHEGELTVCKWPRIDGERSHQDEMQLADTNTAGALGEIVKLAHKATEAYVVDKNAELQEEHAAMLADHHASQEAV